MNKTESVEVNSISMCTQYKNYCIWKEVFKEREGAKNIW